MGVTHIVNAIVCCKSRRARSFAINGHRNHIYEICIISFRLGRAISLSFGTHEIHAAFDENRTRKREKTRHRENWMKRKTKT